MLSRRQRNRKFRGIRLRKRALDYLKNTDPASYNKIKKLAYVTDIVVYITMAIVAVLVVMLLLNMAPMKYNYTVTRNGYYENGQVRYIQNEKQYADMEAYGLDPDDYNEGDTFHCLFDQNDNLTEIIPSEEFENSNMLPMIGIILIIVFVPIILILFVLISRVTILKPYTDYLKWYRANVDNHM